MNPIDIADKIRNFEALGLPTRGNPQFVTKQPPMLAMKKPEEIAEEIWRATAIRSDASMLHAIAAAIQARDVYWANTIRKHQSELDELKGVLDRLGETGI